MVVVQDGPQQENEKPLRIYGDPQKVEHAKQLVYDLIAEKEMEVSVSLSLFYSEFLLLVLNVQSQISNVNLSVHSEHDRKTVDVQQPNMSEIRMLKSSVFR